MQQAACRNADTVIVLDFETTGMSPDQGDRAIEIGAVKLEAGQLADRFQGLMNPGLRVSAFIEGLTGISNEMLVGAPACEEVMNEFADFIAGHDLVAHNASFDRRFLDAELARIGRGYSGEFACSMLAARRVYRDAPDHKLGTLVAYKGIPHDGTFHRALADAEMTAGLWLGMLGDITARHEFANIPFSLMQELARVPAAAAAGFLGRARRRNQVKQKCRVC
ncbi:MAG TPA: DNA polymerase III subunit epsilon [Gammaproteobacteria bacterium]|nr:DNA polymerase III subunit epsilon [Gammaproteobacteria bacterium]